MDFGRTNVLCSVLSVHDLQRTLQTVDASLVCKEVYFYRSGAQLGRSHGHERDTADSTHYPHATSEVSKRHDRDTLLNRESNTFGCM